MSINDKELSKKITMLINKLQSGLFDEVVSGANILLKKSNDQIIYNILSLAYQGNGDYDKSINLLEGVIKLKPKNIFFINNLGLSFFKKGDFIKSEYYYKRGMEIDPNYINILNNYGNLKKELDLFEESIQFFEKILKINPNILEANYNLATVYQSLGQYEKSLNYFRRTLKINPNFTKADRGISSLTKYTLGDSHFIEMHKKMENYELRDFEILELYFALGKAYEDIKDYHNSFKYIEKANSLVKHISGYKIEKDQKLFKKIKDFFKQDHDISVNYNETKIIFILGMPRSGTSLVEQIISSHKKVFGGGELSYLNEIIEKNYLHNQGLDLNNLSEITNTSQKEYISKISLKNKTLKTFTDKSPLNFRWIGFLMKIFPNAKIIHCKKDKLEVCWSNFKNFFEGGLSFSNNLKDLSLYYKLYEDIMRFWDNKYKDKIYNLNHHMLVDNPEIEIKKLINFCELEWDENCLKHETNTRPIKTVSFNQARKPIYKESVRNVKLYEQYLTDLKKNINN